MRENQDAIAGLGLELFIFSHNHFQPFGGIRLKRLMVLAKGARSPSLYCSHFRLASRQDVSSPGACEFGPIPAA